MSWEDPGRIRRAGRVLMYDVPIVVTLGVAATPVFLVMAMLNMPASVLAVVIPVEVVGIVAVVAAVAIVVLRR